MEHQDAVLAERQGDVAVLTLNEPDRRNPLSRAIVGQLSTHLDNLATDDTCKVVVITGAGRGFCAGGDVSRMSESSVYEDRRELAEILALNELVWSYSKPTIAAVHGFAMGGGCSLMAWCDFSLVEAGTRIGLPEVSVGLPAATVVPTLLRTVGRRGTLELTLSGKDIDLGRAVDLGLISRVVPPGAARAEAVGLGLQIAENDGTALSLTKQIINAVQDMTYRQGLDLSRETRVIAKAARGR